MRAMHALQFRGTLLQSFYNPTLESEVGLAQDSISPKVNKAQKPKAGL